MNGLIMKNLHRLSLTVLLLSLSVLALPAQTSSSEPRELLLMFWNLENFFDYIDGGASESDKEFSALEQEEVPGQVRRDRQDPDVDGRP